MKTVFRRLCAAICILALCLTPASALSVEDALTLLEDNYVEKLPAAAYEAATLDELFGAVGDPYTYYMTPEKLEAFNNVVESENSVTGLGVAINYTDEGIRIMSVLRGSGAMDAGLTEGDLIIAIDGVSCVPAGEQFRPMIIGEAGTYINITVRHANGTTEDYRIERRKVDIHNTTVSAENGVTTIDCDSFGSLTADYFQTGIEENEKNTRIWVVDLRNNAGGLASAAVSALGDFTGFGPKIYYRERGGGYYYTLHREDAITDKPVIVLTNGNSASASEILAGGIRAGGGVVLGGRTYGKGTAQIVYDGTNRPDLFTDDALKVTVYRFFCADGNTTDKIGVIPTLLVDGEQTEAVAALLCGEKPEKGQYLRLHLNGCDFYIDPAALKSEEQTAAFKALLAALPPDALLVEESDKGAAKLDIADAVAKYGDPDASRWFDDVADSPYRTEIDTLATYGVLRGSSDGKFDPDRTLTRAELCAMLAQAMDIAGRDAAPFADVSQDSWYAESVNAMTSLELVNGVGGRRFDPEGSLTQEQLIAVMGRFVAFLNIRAANYVKNLNDDLSQFEALTPFASWARGGAAVLTEFAADNGPGAGEMLYDDLPNIDPHALVTREQAAATLCRVFKNLGILAY